MIDYFKLALSKYAEFNGRSRRSEYWYFVLGQFILGLIAGVIDGAMGMQIVGGLVSLALLVPGIAVSVRRLHDVGRSGWWLLIALTGIGIFVLLYWHAMDGEPESNKWGSNPKNKDVDIADHLTV